MSLGIVFKGPEGIVLAADSRVTLTSELRQPNTQPMLLASTYDSATKLLKVGGQDHVAAVTYGAGALDGGGAPRTAHSYIPEFEAELVNTGHGGRLAVQYFAQRLSDFFQGLWQAANMPANSTPMVFLIGGFDEGEPYGRVFRVQVPNQLTPEEQNANDFGVTWGGQMEIVQRLLNGLDLAVPQHIQQALQLTDQQTQQLMDQVRSEVALPIPYAFLPLQDCIDLSILLVRTTVALQSFSIGIRGVGGAIDVATITRSEGFRAVQQKEIRGEGAGRDA